MGSVGFLRGPAMDTRRSYYLLSRQNDFSELDAGELDDFDISDIPWVIPANDNTPTKFRLTASCTALLRRLVVLHSFR
jgi:hypothetical protein